MTVSRIPLEQKPPRMESLARLPLFFALDGKARAGRGRQRRGGLEDRTALRRRRAGRRLCRRRLAKRCSTLAALPPRGLVVLHRREWQDDDFKGAAIAIGACEDADDAARFSAAARAAGVPVNVIDKPDFCDFAFGSIVNRSPLVIGISTDGAAPVFAQAIRAKLEAMIPQGFARWADAARRWRAPLKSSGLSFAARRRFWQIFTGHAVRNPDQDPQQSDFNALLAATQAEGESVERGSVLLVGAGPGDPELLTLRAVRAMQSADVILFDDLVSPQVLDFARREAKKMLVGKSGHGPACKQSEINALMVSLARNGKRVVRLKGGDPMIFGRASEEIEACRNAGISVEIVPGVTAAQGAAARLGISLTHRESARRLQYVTGHGADGNLPDNIDWQEPCRSGGDNDRLYAEKDACRACRQGDRCRA